MLRKRATAIEFSEGLGNPTLTAPIHRDVPRVGLYEPPSQPLRFCFAFCTFFLHEPYLFVTRLSHDWRW